MSIKPRRERKKREKKGRKKVSDQPVARPRLTPSVQFSFTMFASLRGFRQIDFLIFIRPSRLPCPLHANLRLCAIFIVAPGTCTFQRNQATTVRQRYVN